VSNLPLALG
jgi:hypothetical protein